MTSDLNFRFIAKKPEVDQKYPIYLSYDASSMRNHQLSNENICNYSLNVSNSGFIFQN